MEQPRVRIGFIGAGAICRDRHLPGLAKLSGIDLVAVANRSPQSGRKVAADFGIREVMDDWKKLIARPDIDAVFIGTWPYMHMEMSVAALDAGKHVFCQARMAMNLDQAKRMLAAAQAHPTLVNMVCPPPHRMPFEPYIRQVLQREQLGTLTLVSVESVTGANLNRQAVHWRERGEFSGLHTLAMGIYAEVLDAWVGPYVDLSARVSTPITRKTDAAGQTVAITVPQVVTITGTLAGGVPIVEHHTGLASDNSTLRNRITLWGTQGTLRHDFLSDAIEIAESGKALYKVAVPAELCKGWHVEAEFITAVRCAMAGQRWRVSPDFAEAILYMRKVEAVHRAAQTASVVRPGEL